MQKTHNGQPTHRVLSLGAGVQSTTIYLMMVDGLIPPAEIAIFADTQEEPGPVYKHLRWLQEQPGPEIWIRTRGKLGDDLMRGTNSSGQRFAAVPFFTYNEDGTQGQTRRQCSKEYKSEVIERAIRREFLGLKPGQRAPKDILVQQVFGISLDEAGRAARIRERMERSAKWSVPDFPLLMERGMTRQECREWLEQRVPHEVPKSSCVFCPYHSDQQWMDIRDRDPEGWARAVQIDDALRKPGVIVNRNMDNEMFAWRGMKPLTEAEFKHERQFNMFNAECEGLCGV